MNGLLRERILSQLQAVGAPPDLISGFQTAAETLLAIEVLRESEGNSVQIFCDNPEPLNSEDRNAIYVCGDFTGWEEVQYTGASLLDCLMKARKAQSEHALKMDLRTAEDKSTE